jgi:hypothetical protein
LIEKNNEIIGERIIKSSISEANKDCLNWIPVYHGTRFVSLQHILIFGFQCYRESLNGNIPIGEKVDNISN